MEDGGGDEKEKQAVSPWWIVRQERSIRAGNGGATIGYKGGARGFPWLSAGTVPRGHSLLDLQLLLLLPSVVLFFIIFSVPHALHSSGRSSSPSSNALSLRFPTMLAADDTLTAGADALEALDNSLKLPALPELLPSHLPFMAAAAPGLDGPAEAGIVTARAGGGGPDASPGNATSRPSGSEAGEDDVVKAAVVDIDMVGLSAAAAASRREKEMQLSQQKTSCSCYRVANPYCCSQVLCVCGPLCWNGVELVAQVSHGSAAVACEESSREAVSSLLQPITCGKLLGDGQAPLEEVLNEGGFRGMGKRDLGWLDLRREAATWRLDGATFVRQLDLHAASDAAAFAARLFPLLLLNNATLPALVRPAATHLLLPRDRFFRALVEERGPDGLLPQLLELLLRRTLEPLGVGSGGFVVPEWHRQRTVSEEKDLAAEELLGQRGGAAHVDSAGIAPGGVTKHVEYERAWGAATESRPLCMERAILPGTLKGLVYPGSAAQAGEFQEHAVKYLGLEPSPTPEVGGRPRLLFARRADESDRVLAGESEGRLQRLFSDLGFQVEVLDVGVPQGMVAGGGGGPLTLSRVVRAVRAADVIVGLHNSALVHAGVFLRPGTVVLELVPHHLFFSDTQLLVGASGGLFLQHMCHPGASPAKGHSASRTVAGAPGGEGGTVGGRGGSGGGAFFGAGEGDGEVVDFEALDKEYAKHTVAHCMNPRLNYACRQYFMRDRPIALTPEDEEDVSALLGLAKHFADMVRRDGLPAAAADLGLQMESVCKMAHFDLGFTMLDWLWYPHLPSGHRGPCILKRATWRQE